MLIFLGGTVNESTWRDELIPMLDIDYFNPVVSDWDESAQQREIEERQSADLVLYVITPRMKGVYAIAEVVQDSNLRPEKTIFMIMKEDGDQSFDEHQLKSLNMVGKMISENGGLVLDSLGQIANYVNDFEESLDWIKEEE